MKAVEIQGVSGVLGWLSWCCGAGVRLGCWWVRSWQAGYLEAGWNAILAMACAVSAGSAGCLFGTLRVIEGV
ncbi:MAG: hypothetical protein ACK5DM_24205 [Planctomyces sp.]